MKGTSGSSSSSSRWPRQNQHRDKTSTRADGWTGIVGCTAISTGSLGSAHRAYNNCPARFFSFLFSPVFSRSETLCTLDAIPTWVAEKQQKGSCNNLRKEVTFIFQIETNKCEQPDAVFSARMTGRVRGASIGMSCIPKEYELEPISPRRGRYLHHHQH